MLNLDAISSLKVAVKNPFSIYNLYIFTLHLQPTSDTSSTESPPIAYKRDNDFSDKAYKQKHCK